MKAKPMETAKIHERYLSALEHIRTHHLRIFPGCEKPVFLIGETYAGVWLEHVWDAVFWALHDRAGADVAVAQVDLFLRYQKPDGQLPCYVLDGYSAYESAWHMIRHTGGVCYGQLQEVASFARAALEAARLSQNEAFLARAYEGCARWDMWLMQHRNTRGTGLVELFCEFDTGLDNCPRVMDGGIPRQCAHADARICPDLDFMPLLAPDLSAHVYGSRMALAEMAELLGRREWAGQWRERANEIKQLIHAYCFDPEDEFFYDVDRQGNFRKYRTIHITRLFQEHVLDQDLADRIYERYLRNPAEFWTPYPFPSVSLADPSFDSSFSQPNSWGCWSNALTALRSMMWMDHYGKGKDLYLLLGSWLQAYASAEECFSQGLHPISGATTPGINWYSSGMLLYLHAAERLGLAPAREELFGT